MGLQWLVRKLHGVRHNAESCSFMVFEQAFEQYGEIEEGAVITDKATGKSRGFGFITFKHMDSAQRALKEPSKNIDVSLFEPADSEWSRHSVSKYFFICFR